MNDTPELIKLLPSWHVRTTVSTGGNNPKGQFVRISTSELVYGIREVVTGGSGVHVHTITGECHHKLHGPTAEASIKEMADRLNERGYVPEVAKRQPPSATDQSLLSPEMLQSSISYGPNYRPKKARK